MVDRSAARLPDWVDATRDRLAGWIDTLGDWEGWRLDAVFTVLVVWMIGGITWDFHTHAHGISFAEEGFFTDSHIVFYAAFVAIALLITLVTYANYRRGRALLDAIPHGYRLGVLGVGLFALGGPADFLWHSTFGFEVGVEALTSPSHLLLAIGATLFLSAPLRAAWNRSPSPTGIRQLPLLLSATIVGVLVTFFTVYQNPLTEPFGTPGGPAPDQSFLGILWFTAIIVALVATLLRRFELTLGAFTLLLGVLGLLVTAIHLTFEFVPAMLITGLAIDVVYYGIRDRWRLVRTVRLVGAALPTLLFTLYFATVAIQYGLGWAVHIWTGGIVSAGLVGLLVSYVAIPSRHFEATTVEVEGA